MKPHFLIGLLLFAFGTSRLVYSSHNHLPENGVLDLTGTTFTNETLYNLNGEWEFYWEKLLTPSSYPAEKKSESGIKVNVPSYWESYEVNGENLPGYGYGTYAMTIILPAGYRSAVCMDIPLFDVAYNFYLNDRLVGRNGKVGTSREEEEPWYEPSRFCYIPSSDTLQILIQVSNFNHRRGGFWQSVLVGGSEEILGRAERRKIINYSTIGVLFFFTLFFVIFWTFSKKDYVMLFFALTALGILIRSLNTGLYASNAFIHTPWVWQIRFEYFGTYLAHIGGMIFLHRMFPRKYMKHVITGNSILTLLLIVSVFILSPRLFTYTMLIFQPLILLFLTHYLLVSLIGMFRRRFMDAIFFISLGLFIYTLINDILLANSASSVSNNYMSQISFQVFIFAMAVMIIMQWVKNYQTRLQLESSLRFKNKVLSVIAHDLKNPVASIAQFSDLLVTKPELVNNANILNSLQESSQSAVSLLDNLLYWGRTQADELSVSPVNLEMESLIAGIVSLFTHMAVQKEVSIQTNVFPGTTVYADKALTNIVIRNLVSNAIKFTPGKGTVSIQVQPETNKVRVSVSDTGIGIKPEILEHFKNGGKLESTVGTDKEIGTGLGLKLVSDLVDRSGGKLKIDSEAGTGSTFTFTLPAGKTKEEE